MYICNKIETETKKLNEVIQQIVTKLWGKMDQLNEIIEDSDSKDSYEIQAENDEDEEVVELQELGQMSI